MLPEVWSIIKPRRWLLLFGLFLMAINRSAGLILPVSTKFLIDKVLGPHGDPSKLLPLVGIVFTATAIQAVTSFSLTQLLSKAAQRMITELRKQVQQHIGRLSVSFYDANRTGVLVSRIMTDVEGVRNLIGTGLVEFVGGFMTAVGAFIFLLLSSRNITLDVFAVILVFVVVLQRAFKTIRPIFRERGKINAEVTGRLTESLGGVRVVKGYHAEEREAGVFAQGVQRLLDNVMRRSPRPAALSLPRRRCLVLSADWSCYLAAGNDRAQAYHGRLLPVHDAPGLHDRARFPDCEYRYAADRGACRSRPYGRDSNEQDEFNDPKRTVRAG